MAGTNLPVAFWTFAPIAGAGFEIYDRYKRQDVTKAATERNPLLKAYYEGQPTLTDRNYNTEHRTTVDYLRRASLRGAADAVNATLALVGGHYISDVGKTFNALIHGPASAGALYTMTRAGWILVRRLSTMQRAADQDLVNTWITGLLALKIGRGRPDPDQHPKHCPRHHQGSSWLAGD